jgi:hypothetical protein
VTVCDWPADEVGVDIDGLESIPDSPVAETGKVDMTVDCQSAKSLHVQDCRIH